MKTINYIQDTEKFWQAHKESRDAIDRDIESRPIKEQRVIRAKTRANHTAMRNAKKEGGDIVPACTCVEPWAGDPAFKPSCPAHGQ